MRGFIQGALIVGAATAMACRDATSPTADPADAAVAGSASRSSTPTAWTTPVELGTPLTVADGDTRNAIEDARGLTLYFGSVRPGTEDGRDIFVSHRSRLGAPWGPATNLGAVLNPGVAAPHNDNHASTSPGGHWLFFVSSRDGGCGGLDIYVSHRRDVHNDLGWEPPKNLGCQINTDANEKAPILALDPGTGRWTLYFASAGEDGSDDLFMSVRGADGVWRKGVPVTGLNSPDQENRMAIRADGLEVFISSDRPAPGGEDGAFNTWTSTRRSVRDPWSTPEPVILGLGLPTLSFDATRLYLTGPQTADPDLAGTFLATRRFPGGGWFASYAAASGVDVDD